MGLLDRYNKSIAAQTGLSSENPEATAPSKQGNPEAQFKGSSLDLENPAPAGGPINVPYTSKVGAEIITSPTTQPYTPQRTYTDSFTNPDLIARAIDPFK